MANGKRTGLRYKGAPGVARQAGSVEKLDGPAKIKTGDVGRPRTQAHRVFLKFGGVTNLFDALTAIGEPRQLNAIYKWLYPREKGGSDGLVPTSAMPDVLKAARMFGIVLTSEDLDPRALPVDTTVKKIKNNRHHDL